MKSISRNFREIDFTKKKIGIFSLIFGSGFRVVIISDISLIYSEPQHVYTYIHTKSVGGRTLWDQMDYSNGDKIEVQSTAHIRNKYNGIKSLPNLQYNYYAILCNIFLQIFTKVLELYVHLMAYVY